jgi:hypothetical protein
MVRIKPIVWPVVPSFPLIIIESVPGEAPPATLISKFDDAVPPD